MLCALALLPGCRGSKVKSVSVIGSTSVEPFAEYLAEKFEEHNGDIKIDVQGGGSTAGLQALTSGLADIGMCSRSLSAAEKETLQPIVIARDGLAVIVNLSNPIGQLTLDQVRQLYAGKITNWKELGGPDRNIHLIMREEGSGTREAFMNMVMGKQDPALRALVQESNGAVRELVSTDPAAVGYISLGLVNPQVKALKIGGVAATSANVINGSYTLVRPFLFVVHRGMAGSAPVATAPNQIVAAHLAPQAWTFIDFVLSPAGQALLESQGLVRVK